MSVEIREYSGTPQYEKGGPAPQKRDALKLTLRGSIRRFREIGDQALNAMDYERTRHLPVGKGRLACDPDTGDFDPDASRPMYNPANHSKFPKHLHSNVTEGDYIEVNDAMEMKTALASGRWQEKPLEKKKRFSLSQDDLLQNFQGQLLAERARGLDLERRLELVMRGGNAASAPEIQEQVSIESVRLKQLEDDNKALTAKLDAVLSFIQKTNPEMLTETPESVDEASNNSDPEDEDEDTEEEEPVAAVTSRGRTRRS